MKICIFSAILSTNQQQYWPAAENFSTDFLKTPSACPLCCMPYQFKVRKGFCPKYVPLHSCTCIQAHIG